VRTAILLIPIALSSIVAGAQPPGDEAHGAERRVSHAEERRDCPPSTPHTPSAPCDQVSVRVETPLTVTATLKPPKSAYCAATYETKYTQKGAKVGVDGVIENKDCAASSGELKLLVRIRDETGEVKTLDFLESWRREDDRPVKFGGDYPIGENVDLVSVRTVQVRCTCADAPAAE
jgi:hypothetical protein